MYSARFSEYRRSENDNVTNAFSHPHAFVHFNHRPFVTCATGFNNFVPAKLSHGQDKG